MPTVQQLPAAVAVNLTDEVMLDQNGTSVAATIGQVLTAQPVGAGLLFSGGTLDADVTVLAPLVSPAFGGTPTAPTPPVGDDSNRVATTAFVLANAAGGGGGVGGTLTLTGDVSGSGTGTIDVTLAAVATPGTYEKVTIDAKGRVLAGASLAAADLASALAGADASGAIVTTAGASTSRALGVRAGDRVNVLDFGADPMGAADSAPAFTAAMASMAAGWGLLWVPRGSYKLDTAVNQPAGVSVRVLFDDGADIATGSVGYLGVDCVEAHQGAYRYRQVSGGYFGFTPTIAGPGYPGFVADYITNTPQNSKSLRIGWDHRYTNSNLYGKVHNGIDLAQQRIHSWPNLYDNSSGWGLWEVIQGATLDENSMATAGLASSAEVSETDVVNNSFEAGWTWRSGLGNPVQGKAIDPWGNVSNGNYGGNILFAWGSVGSYDGAVGGLNFRWWCYPAVFSAGNPTATAGTIVINGTTVNVTAAETVAAIAAAINAAAIAGVGAAANTWGGVVTRLVIYDTTANDAGTLTLSGTALASLGLTAGTYTTPRGDYAMVMGGSGTVAVGAQFTVNGVTITVGGAGAMSDVAAAINAAAGIQGIAADVNANGQLVVTCYMPQQAGGLTLADVSGQTTLATLRLNGGTFLPPTPPKAFATASGDQTAPVCQTTDQIAISFTTAGGAAYGPVTVTLSGGAGTGWPADVASSISAALSTAGYLAADFTAPGSGAAIVAVRSTNAGGQQGVQIRNTGGGTLTLADAHGTPLETLGIAPGTYQPGGYSAGSQTVFMAAEDSIAPGGRGWFTGGASNATDLTVWPHAPGEARGSFLHGLRLDQATLHDGVALRVGATHAIAFGPFASDHLFTVTSGTAEVDGVPVVNSGIFDAQFGSETGDTLVRTAAGWAALTPGSSGQYLTANGPGTPLAWATPVPNAAVGTLLAATGTSGVAGTITATAVLDAQFGAETGDILVRSAAGWVALTPGNSGQSLMANGPGTPLAWTTGIPTAPAGTLLAASGTAGVAQTLALGTNLSVTSGTLNAAGGGGSGEWAAGTVDTLGSGLVLTGTTLSAPGGGGSTVVRRAISGFQLTNDATTPATVLDIGAGQCADDATAVWITTAATFYASIGSAWAAGAGTSAAPVGKMGTGLTATASTWYHVFAIVNAGAADFYFDTSVSAANAPSGTTAHRRVGSILLNASAQIEGFAQVLTGAGAYTYWNAVATDYQGAATSTASARQLITLSVPNGPTVRPLVRVSSYNGQAFLLSAPAMADVAPVNGANPEISPGWDAGGGASGGRAYGQIVTTTGQIGFRSTINGPTIGVFTFGYVDERGTGA